MEKKLDFGEILSNAFSIGIKNLASIIGCVVLWILTIWIPYVNVGTTIAIVTLPAALSKGKILSPVQIFDKSYYKYMGEFFLATGLRGIIVGTASIFLIIPGIVMAIAYSLTALLVVDKGKGAADALRLSNKSTYGNKWMIFLWILFYGIVLLFIPMAILRWIWNPLSIIYLIAISSVGFGGMAYVYGQLTSDIPEEN